MNIFFYFFFFHKSGIGRYCQSLLEAFSEKKIRITVCVNFKDRDYFERKFSGCSHVKPVFVDYSHFSFRNYCCHSSLINSMGDFDVLFFPHVNIPPFLSSNKIVLTIHDIRPFSEYWDRGFFKKNIMEILYRYSMRSAKKIICVSKHTQQELNFFGSDIYKKTECLYEFIDTSFFKKQYEKRLVKEKYVLFVGSRKKNKNILTALNSFASLSESIPHFFVLAGGRDGLSTYDQIDSFIFNNDLTSRVIQYVSPSDEQIANLYKHADLFVFPSLFEGFGLPPLEAVASGCPAILSDIPIFREIFDSSAIYFPPLSVNSLSTAMSFLLTNEQERLKLLAKEKNRLKIFDRDKIVDRYIDIFERVAR